MADKNEPTLANDGGPIVARLTLRDELREEEPGGEASGAPLRDALAGIGIQISAADAADAWGEYSAINCASWLSLETDPLWILTHILPFCDIDGEAGADLRAAIPAEEREVHGALVRSFSERRMAAVRNIHQNGVPVNDAPEKVAVKPCPNCASPDVNLLTHHNDGGPAVECRDCRFGAPTLDDWNHADTPLMRAIAERISSDA